MICTLVLTFCLHESISMSTPGRKGDIIRSRHDDTCVLMSTGGDSLGADGECFNAGRERWVTIEEERGKKEQD